jgi:hypothetical protein
MIVATIAAELFTEQNHFPANFISLLGLPFPLFALQPILLINTNFQIDTEKRYAALGGLSAIQIIEADSWREGYYKSHLNICQLKWHKNTNLTIDQAVYAAAS